MDYLAFGLLAGSLIVIASFVVRDALPHLAAFGVDSRLARLSRADAPSAWGRWCADAGLVLAATGTLVLLITVAAVLIDLSDDVGNIVVGLSVAVAMVVSALASARLWRRFGVDAERERHGEPWMAASTPATVVEAADGPTTTDVVEAQRPDRPAPRAIERPVADGADVWDDELPVWSPPIAQERPPARSMPAEVAPDRGEGLATAGEPGAWDWFAPAAGNASPRATAANEGLFSSPLLADIGLSFEEDADDRFRSPLLSDLHDGPLDDGARDDVAAGSGSDLLLDEVPAPVGASGRHRDEIDDG